MAHGGQRVRVWRLDMFGRGANAVARAMQSLRADDGKRAVLIGNDAWWWCDGKWGRVPDSERHRLSGPPGRMRYFRGRGWVVG
jgi:hypothetical protein